MNGRALRDLHVDVRLASLAQSARGAITGEVVVALDSHRFPGPAWNDFVVVILGWWCESCVALLGDATREQFWFMDGPYQFTAEATSDDAWSVCFQTHRLSTSPLRMEAVPVPGLPANVRIRPLAFAHSLANAANAVLRDCERRGWFTPETDQLQLRSDSLRLTSRAHLP